MGHSESQRKGKRKREKGGRRGKRKPLAGITRDDILVQKRVIIGCLHDTAALEFNRGDSLAVSYIQRKKDEPQNRQPNNIKCKPPIRLKGGRAPFGMG